MSQSAAAHPSQDELKVEYPRTSSSSPSSNDASAGSVSHGLPPFSYQESLQPSNDTTQLRPLQGVGIGGTNSPISTYPQPQVQKRGPPATSHPFENPAKKQSKWSADENALITELRGNGMKWEDISKRLPGRSAISCRLHYQNFLERKAEWDEEKKNKLARLYDRFKKDMWDPVAKELGMPWRAVEAMHWELGNDGIAARTGVPVFATATATATEPPSMANAFATATCGPALPPVLAFSSPSSPPHRPADHHHVYQRQPQVTISSVPQHVNPYQNFPPPPQIPVEPSRSRPRRSASSAPSARRRSTSRKRALSGTTVDPQSQAAHAARFSSASNATTSGPQGDHLHAPVFPGPQSAEGERLPPMRFLTEPAPLEQQLLPVSYGRILEPRGRLPSTQSEQIQTHTARGSGGDPGGESASMGGGGDRR